MNAKDCHKFRQLPDSGNLGDLADVMQVTYTMNLPAHLVW